MDKINETLLSDLEDQKMTDCHFEFEDEEKQVLTAHKNVLGSASPVFYAMLFGPLKEPSPIPIKDISMKAFRQLLWNIYGRKFDLQKADEACDLYTAAKKYDIAGALEVARSFMLNTANSSNVSQYYYIAGLFDDAELLKVCDAIFISTVKNVTKQPKFFVSEDFASGQNDFEIDEVKVGSKLNVALKEYKNSIELETCKETRICKTLGFVRFLTIEADKLFSTIMPETTAKLNISTNPGLSESDFDSLKMFLTEVTQRIKMVCSCSGALFFYCAACSTGAAKNNSNGQIKPAIEKLQQAIAMIDQCKADKDVLKAKSIIHDLGTVKLN